MTTGAEVEDTGLHEVLIWDINTGLGIKACEAEIERAIEEDV